MNISSSEAGHTQENPVPTTITFDEPVDKFEESKINVTGGQLSEFYVEWPEYDYQETLSFRMDSIPLSLPIQTEKVIGAIDFDKDGKLYALTFENGVYVYDEQGSSQHLIPGNKFDQPLDIAVNKILEKIYIADSKNNRIAVFDLNGNEETEIGASDGMDIPFGLALDHMNRIYVADSNKDRILIFDSNGNLDDQIDNGSGSGDNQLDNPIRLDVDQLLNIYVNDAGNSRIQIYNSNLGHTETIQAGGAGNDLQSPGSLVVDNYGFLYIAELGDLSFDDFTNIENSDPLALFLALTSADNSVKVFRTGSLQEPPFEISDPIAIPIDLALKECGYLAVNNFNFETKINFDLAVYNRLPDTFTATLTIDQECAPANMYIPEETGKNAACNPIPVNDSGVFSMTWDETPPVIDCPTSTEILYMNTAGEYVLPDYQDFVSADNCDDNDDLIIDQNPMAGTAVTETTSVRLTVTDKAGNETVCNFSVVPESQDNLPKALDDEYNIDQNEVLVEPEPGVLNNDNDADSLTAELITDVSNGTLTLNPDGSFTYEPDLDFFGTDEFTYVANDGEEDSNEATVTITVNQGNSAPEASDDQYTVDQDEVLVESAPGVLVDDNDADSDSLTAKLITDVSNGTLTLNPDGSFTYEPDPGFSGTDEFTYVANDGEEDSNTATVSITVKKDSPPPVEEEVDYIYVYPNPTPGPFRFAVPKNVAIEKVEVYDIRGRFILAEEFLESAVYSMDLTGLQRAIYVLKIFTTDRIETVRIIVY